MATPGNLLAENNEPYVMANGGIRTAMPVYIDDDLTVTGTTNIAGVSLTDLTVTGNTVIGNAVTDTLAITGITTQTVTSSSTSLVEPLVVTTTLSGAGATVVGNMTAAIRIKVGSTTYLIPLATATS